MIKINYFQRNAELKRPKNTDLVNENIRFPEVLVIDEQGKQLGKMSTRDARNIATSHNLDLYCVAPNVNPPVCKILDYGKFRFEKQKKEKENKKKQHVIDIKEIQLTPQIGEHDLLVKIKAASRFLEEGNKVKVGVRFRGRQMTHLEVGEAVMNRFIDELKEVSQVDKAPSMDGRWLNAVLTAKSKK